MQNNNYDQGGIAASSTIWWLMSYFYFSDTSKDVNQEKNNIGPIKQEQLDSEISGKPDSTTTPALNEQTGDGRRPSVGKDGRRFREVSTITI